MTEEWTQPGHASSARRIAQIVAEMLERRIKDPRLGFVTVTEARLTGDLREATVFYTVYGSAQERAGTAAALASATGLIRSEVGRQTGLKHTPSLTFRPDTVPDNGQEHRGTRRPGPRGGRRAGRGQGRCPAGRRRRPVPRARPAAESAARQATMTSGPADPGRAGGQRAGWPGQQGGRTPKMIV